MTIHYNLLTFRPPLVHAFLTILDPEGDDAQKFMSIKAIEEEEFMTNVIR